MTHDEMREALANAEADRLGGHDILMVLLEGCVGWNSIEDTEVERHYAEIFRKPEAKP